MTPGSVMMQGVPRLEEAPELDARRLVPVPLLDVDATQCSVSASGTYMLIVGRSTEVQYAVTFHHAC